MHMYRLPDLKHTYIVGTIAGYLNQRTHVKRGKYRKTGDKKKNKENHELIKTKLDCYGTPSSTKAERELYRKKKEYKKTPEFKAKSTYQDRKKEREVNFADIASKFDLIREDGKIKFVEKPAADPGSEVDDKTKEENRDENQDKNPEEVEGKTSTDPNMKPQVDDPDLANPKGKNPDPNLKENIDKTIAENELLIGEINAKNKLLAENTKTPSSTDDDPDETVIITEGKIKAKTEDADENKKLGAKTFSIYGTKISPPSELVDFGNELKKQVDDWSKFGESKIQSANSTLTDNNNNNGISEIPVSSPELDISRNGLFEIDESKPSQPLSASTPNRNHSSNNTCFSTPNAENTEAAVEAFVKVCERIPNTLNFNVPTNN